MSYPKRAWCECGKRELVSRMVTVKTAEQTHWSPPEYDLICEDCNDKAVREAEMAEERRGLSYEEWNAL